jgi:Rrf2 family protein
MKLTARTRYAIRILLDLARHSGAGPLPATRLSRHTGVSVQFIEPILKALKAAGFTTSARGAGGGHLLARPAAEISLGEVLRIMEGGINLTLCQSEDAADCANMDFCPTRSAWLRVEKTMQEEMDAISVKDLLNNFYAVPRGEKKSLTCKIALSPRGGSSI